MCVSLVSTSLNVTCPLALLLAPSSPSETAPVCAADVITGASLVPVIVILTSWLAKPPWLSADYTVNVPDTLSPAARASTAPASLTVSFHLPSLFPLPLSSAPFPYTTLFRSSLVSTSLNVTCPLALLLAPSSPSETAPVCAADVITGASLVPVIVILTSWLAKPPWL